MTATTAVRMGAGNTDPIASAFPLRFLCEACNHAGRLHCRKPGKTAPALCFTNSHIAHPLAVDGQSIPQRGIVLPMYTIAETDRFKKKAATLWTEEERLAFLVWLASHPLQGDVIPNGGGLRKVRWHMAGKGKRGGVRVIYYNLLADGLIIAADIYAKNERENIGAKDLHNLKEGKP